MLVEKGVKDRYSLAVLVSPNSGGTTEKLDVLVADRPQTIRVRSLRLSVKSDATAGAYMFGALVVTAQNINANSLFVPTVSPLVSVVDLYEPAANVIWSCIGTADSPTNNNVFDREWSGDGRLINLMVGDRLVWLARVEDTGDFYGFMLLDIEILN